MYLESSVSDSYFGCLNDFVWFLNLSLNGPPVLPMYIFVSFPWFIVALYTTEDMRHFPRRGQFAFILQLQDFSQNLGPFAE